MILCKAVIFDLDGVLVHTDRFHYQAWKQLADRFGIPFDETVNHRLRGVSRAESLAIVLESSPRAFSSAEQEAMAEQKNTDYRAFLEQMTPQAVTEETRCTLRALRAQGFLLAIGSSSKNAPLILEKTGLKSFFTAVADGNDLVHSKPNPEVFLKAAERLGVAPQDCAVVEDAVAGVQAAHAAGMPAVAFGDAAARGAGDENLTQFADLQTVLRRGI